LGAPSGDIDAVTFNASGTFYDANSYIFGHLITEPVQAEELLMKLALQCRSRFFVTPYGTAKLIVRELGQASGHAIAKNEIKRDSMSVQRSATSELINNFNIHYNKNHSQEGNYPEDYQSVKNFQDATSIGRYGTRTWNGKKDLFYFDAVVADAMAQDVGDFLLSYHDIVRKCPRLGVFLDNCEIEPGDIIDITHPLDSMSGFICEVQKIIHRLGSARKKVVDHLTINTVEN